jgi:glycosyltransferase involved in cell wall biosynthesis
VRGNYDLILQDELNHPSLFLLNHHLKRHLKLSQDGEIRPPIVSIVHHLRSHEAHPPALRLLYRRIEQAYLRSVDGFLVNSWTTRRAVESLLEQPRPVHVAYPAADHLPRPPLEELRRRAESPLNKGEPLHILFLGNVIPRKGLHTVINALALLVRTDASPPCRLHVIGSLSVDQGYTRHIRALANKHTLGDSIKFYGTVEDAQLSTLLAAGHILAVPSFEGFGIVYLEAMAHGLCPIGGAQSAAQEIITQGETGFLVPLENAHALAKLFAQLAATPERLAACRLAALEWYSMYPTWSETFSSTSRWLHEVTWLEKSNDI